MMVKLKLGLGFSKRGNDSGGGNSIPAPTGLGYTSTWNNDLVQVENHLTWDVHPDTNVFNIYLGGSLFTSVTGANEYLHQGASPSTFHEYEVRAVVDGNESPSASISFTSYALRVITNFTSGTGYDAGYYIDLSWDYLNGAEHYNIYRDNSFWKQVNAVNTYRDASLNEYTEYSYVIKAVDIDDIEWQDSFASTVCTSFTRPRHNVIVNVSPEWGTDPLGPTLAVFSTDNSGPGDPTGWLIDYSDDNGSTWTNVFDNNYLPAAWREVGTTGVTRYYRVTPYNAAGYDTNYSGIGYSTFPAYDTVNFGQGANNVRQANPLGSSWPWINGDDYIYPNNSGLQNVNTIRSSDSGQVFAVGRPSYIPQMQAYYDNGKPVILCDVIFDVDTIGKNYQFKESGVDYIWSFGSGDFTFYIVYYHQDGTGSPFMCNRDGTADQTMIAVAGAFFFQGQSATYDQLFSANIPSNSTDGWRVVVVQRRSGIITMKINDPGGSPATDSIASSATDTNFTAIGPDDTGFLYGAPLKFKAIGFADVAYNGELDYLYNYLATSFL